MGGVSTTASLVPKILLVSIGILLALSSHYGRAAASPISGTEGQACCKNCLARSHGVG